MRPGSANANGIPVGDPHAVPTSGTVSAMLAVAYLRTLPATSRPSGRLLESHSSCWRNSPRLTLQSTIDSIDSAQKSTASDERAQVRAGAAGAERLVDRDAEQVGVLAGGHLAQQLLVLAFLDVAVEVGHAAALLGAAVDREQPPVGRA